MTEKNGDRRVTKDSHRRMWLLMTTKISERRAWRASVAAVTPVRDVTAKFAPWFNSKETMSKLPLLTASTHKHHTYGSSTLASKSKSIKSRGQLFVTSDFLSTSTLMPVWTRL